MAALENGSTLEIKIVPRSCIPPWAGGITTNAQTLCRPTRVTENGYLASTATDPRAGSCLSGKLSSTQLPRSLCQPTTKVTFPALLPEDWRALPSPSCAIEMSDWMTWFTSYIAFTPGGLRHLERGRKAEPGCTPTHGHWQPKLRPSMSKRCFGASKRPLVFLSLTVLSRRSDMAAPAEAHRQHPPRCQSLTKTAKNKLSRRLHVASDVRGPR